MYTINITLKSLRKWIRGGAKYKNTTEATPPAPEAKKEVAPDYSQLDGLKKSSELTTLGKKYPHLSIEDLKNRNDLWIALDTTAVLIQKSWTLNPFNNHQEIIDQIAGIQGRLLGNERIDPEAKVQTYLVGYKGAGDVDTYDVGGAREVTLREFLFRATNNIQLTERLIAEHTKLSKVHDTVNSTKESLIQVKTRIDTEESTAKAILSHEQQEDTANLRTFLDSFEARYPQPEYKTKLEKIATKLREGKILDAINEMNALLEKLKKPAISSGNEGFARAFRGIDDAENAAKLGVKKISKTISEGDTKQEFTDFLRKKQAELDVSISEKMEKKYTAMMTAPGFEGTVQYAEVKKDVSGFKTKMKQSILDLETMDAWIRMKGESALDGFGDMAHTYNEMRGLIGITNFTDKNAKMTRDIAVGLASFILFLPVGGGLFKGAELLAKTGKAIKDSAAIRATALAGKYEQASQVGKAGNLARRTGNLATMGGGVVMAKTGETFVKIAEGLEKLSQGGKLSRLAINPAKNAVLFSITEATLNKTLDMAYPLDNPMVDELGFLEKMMKNYVMFVTMHGAMEGLAPVLQKQLFARLGMSGRFGELGALSVSTMSVSYMLHGIETGRYNPSDFTEAEWASIIVPAAGMLGVGLFPKLAGMMKSRKITVSNRSRLGIGESKVESGFLIANQNLVNQEVKVLTQLARDSKSLNDFLAKAEAYTHNHSGFPGIMAKNLASGESSEIFAKQAILGQAQSQVVKIFHTGFGSWTIPTIDSRVRSFIKETSIKRTTPGIFTPSIEVTPSSLSSLRSQLSITQAELNTLMKAGRRKGADFSTRIPQLTQEISTLESQISTVQQANREARKAVVSKAVHTVTDPVARVGSAVSGAARQAKEAIGSSYAELSARLKALSDGVKGFRDERAINLGSLKEARQTYKDLEGDLVQGIKNRTLTSEQSQKMINDLNELNMLMKNLEKARPHLRTAIWDGTTAAARGGVEGTKGLLQWAKEQVNIGVKLLDLRAASSSALHGMLDKLPKGIKVQLPQNVVQNLQIAKNGTLVFGGATLIVAPWFRGAADMVNDIYEIISPDESRNDEATGDEENLPVMAASFGASDYKTAAAAPAAAAPAAADPAAAAPAAAAPAAAAPAAAAPIKNTETVAITPFSVETVTTQINNLQSQKEAIIAIQTALQALGYDPHGIDGKYGPNTKQAVEDFQRAKGLTVDGKLFRKDGAGKYEVGETLQKMMSLSPTSATL